ncbi:hypothetical protein GCK72_021580 [Caenorhabditis remanei]|uniref:NR LBD domain-containing protein n=1 Tax=Caenorhabditis remanei TaxID=31234 RepID=A0A6A5GK16_CAERE|nr:hypothetical protein GCK72_021580 [Caenorhabditis remanei]KAF1755013.1 hypothetical protein GCK72_021580 [Caenorhabditis remanei]
MDPEKVILDYDPTASQKVPTMTKMDSKLLEKQGSEPEKSKENMKIIKIDFSELVEKIEEIFETKTETSKEEEDDLGLSDSVYLNDLQNLTKGLEEFRAPIWSKGEIQQLGNADMKKVFIWLNVRIRKYATWFSHATYLMEKLPMDQKFQLYRTSWNVMRMFERIAMTWKHYGHEMFEGNFILVSDDTVMIVNKSLVHFEEISELTDDYFQKLFHPFLNKYIEEVARPLSELNLTEEEVVFCMVHILGFDVTGLAPETLEILHKFKEIISDQMHNYYMNSTNFKIYSHRIMKLMKLVNSMTVEFYSDAIYDDWREISKDFENSSKNSQKKQIQRVVVRVACHNLDMFEAGKQIERLNPSLASIFPKFLLKFLNTFQNLSHELQTPINTHLLLKFIDFRSENPEKRENFMDFSDFLYISSLLDLAGNVIIKDLLENATKLYPDDEKSREIGARDILDGVLLSEEVNAEKYQEESF